MTLTASRRPSEQGFTLVELAIVMVIIGLLIGGILKGQELIANAKISSTVGQLKGLDAAINTFKDKYNVEPGFMADAQTRLPGCVDPCVNVAAGTTMTTLAAPTATADPKVQTFLHLNAADLITGIDASGSVLGFGKTLPAVKAGGGMWVGRANAAAELGGNTTLSPGTRYAVLTQAVTTPSGTTGGVYSATTAAQIDRKIDDGLPRTGGIQAMGQNCQNTASPVAYDEGNAASSCSIVSKVLN